MAITIAMPVLNGGRNLALAVQSMREQSFTRWELLVLDDGSTDGAVEALDGGADQRIRVVSDGKNRGLSARLNEAVRLAKGWYFARMDHDDVSHSRRLQQQFEFLELHPEIDLLGTRCLAMDESERIIGTLPAPTTHQKICARPWLGFYLAHPTWMGRTEWFRRNPYLEPGPYRCEDQELLLRTYERSQFAALPDALLAYRVRDRPRLGTLARTRLTLAQEQIRHFSKGGRPLMCALSALAAMARIGADVMSPTLGAVFPVRGVTRVAPGPDEREWQRAVSEIRRRAEKSSSQ